MRKIRNWLASMTALALLALLPVTALAADETGDFKITGGTEGTDYTYADGVLTVNNNADLTISMASNSITPTSDRIVVAASATATITLYGVSITAPQEKSAIEIPSGSTLTLILPTGSESSLVGGSWDSSDLSGNSSGCAGIHVPNGATLNIKCSETDTHTCLETSCGKLSATGGHFSAGIGGKQNEGCGKVVIDGGIVTASGNSAGIGGGDHGSGGDITITGGIVTATGGLGAAGIGGAGNPRGVGGLVKITGGVVAATGNGGGAGIGGGDGCAGATVVITGGIVTATVDVTGGGNAAGIGGGDGAMENGTFSTSTNGTTGNAVIFASSNLEGNEIGDDYDTSNWSGVIFQGTGGKVYGNVSLSDSFKIPSGYTLEIPDGATLTIPEGVIITNNGTIDVVDGGKLDPQSKVSGSGTVRQLYTVTFDMNGHGTAPDDILAVKDSTITQPTAPTAEGYIFDGWYKDSGCTTAWNFDSDTVTSTIWLYAKWTQSSVPIVPVKPVYVRYIVEHYKESRDGYVLAETEYPTGKIGDTVTAQPKDYDGYVYNAAASTSSGILTAIEDEGDILTLRLYYDEAPASARPSESTPPSYTVTVEDADYGTITVRPTRAEKGDTVTITVKPDDGYALGELTVTDKNGEELRLTEKGENKFTFKMPASKVTVYASFMELAPEPVPEPEPIVLPFDDVPQGAWYEEARPCSTSMKAA